MSFQVANRNELAMAANPARYAHSCADGGEAAPAHRLDRKTAGVPVEDRIGSKLTMPTATDNTAARLSSAEPASSASASATRRSLKRRRGDLAGNVDDAERTGIDRPFAADENAADVSAGLGDDAPGAARAVAQRGQRIDALARRTTRHGRRPSHRRSDRRGWRSASLAARRRVVAHTTSSSRPATGDNRNLVETGDLAAGDSKDDIARRHAGASAAEPGPRGRYVGVSRPTMKASSANARIENEIGERAGRDHHRSLDSGWA